MIGIIGAMDVEVNALKQITENAQTEIISGIEFVSGKICGKDIVAAVCGIGKVFAAIATEAMILNFKPDVIINSGVAGALDAKLKISDIVIADSVVQHDMNTTAFGDPKGFISGLNIVEIPCSAKICKSLKIATDKLSINAVSGKIASGDLFVSTLNQKKKIAEIFDASACEMEGASIGQVCYVNNTDFAVLRSISDTLADGSDMEYSEFVEIAAANSVKVIKSFIEEY